MMPLLLAADTAVSPVVQFLFDHVLELVSSVVLSALVPWVKRWLEARTDEANASAAQKGLAKTALVLTEMAASVVALIEVDFKPKLKAALADGKLTDAEKAELRTEALRLLKEKAPAEVLKQAEGHFGPFVDMLLKGLIERQYQSQKAEALKAERLKAVAPLGEAARGNINDLGDALRQLEAL